MPVQSLHWAKSTLLWTSEGCLRRSCPGPLWASRHRRLFHAASPLWRDWSCSWCLWSWSISSRTCSPLLSRVIFSSSSVNLISDLVPPPWHWIFLALCLVLMGLCPLGYLELCSSYLVCFLLCRLFKRNCCSLCCIIILSSTTSRASLALPSSSNNCEVSQVF